ncbi:hypothetical protein M5689_023058 [Euphorbia peplus]|nr:hypothetical protein M5689_023058 [Euphorbia peplus]
MAKTFLACGIFVMLASMLFSGMMLHGVEGKSCSRKIGECEDGGLVTPLKQNRCKESLYIAKTGCTEEDCHDQCVEKHPLADVASGCIDIATYISCLCIYNC